MSNENNTNDTDTETATRTQLEIVAVFAQAIAISRIMGVTIDHIYGESPMTADRVLACQLLAARNCQQAEAENGLHTDWEGALRNAVEDVIAVVKSLNEQGVDVLHLETERPTQEATTPVANPVTPEPES